MHNRQKAQLFLGILCLVLTASSAWAGETTTQAKSILLQPSVTVELGALKDKLAAITVGGKSYTPTESGKAICSVKVTVRNAGESDFQLSGLDSLEMVLVDKKGSLEYVEWTKPFDFSNNDFKGFDPNGVNAQKNLVKGGEDKTDTLFFIHSKGFIPAAIVSNRVEQLILLKADDPRNEPLKASLAKETAFQTALKMASVLPFELVSEFLQQNGLDINYKNRYGVSVLYAGIFGGNNSVIEGAIKQGADIHAEVMMSIYRIEPIHAAVLAHNKAAAQSLLASGASLTVKPKGGDEPAVLAVRQNNIDALRLLAELGVDIKGLMIPMSWSGALPIEKYARTKGLTEMVAFLETL